MRRPTVVSVFDVQPRFIGGTETYARELSVQLGRRGWQSALCFAAAPTKDVERFLDLPNVSIEVVDFLRGGTLGVMSQLARVMWHHGPQIVHFHYTGFLSPYPWLAHLLSAEDVFFTDQTSRPENYSSHQASSLKRCLARVINWPLSRVICVSEYGYRCLTERGLLPVERFAMIYNGVDLQRVEMNAERATAFRRRFFIPDGRKVVLQVSWVIPERVSSICWQRLTSSSPSARTLSS